MKIKFTDIILLGGIAAGGYLLYKYLMKPAAAVKEAGESVINVFTNPFDTGQAAAAAGPVIADTGGYIKDYLTGLGYGSTGFDIPTIPDNPPAEQFAGITENLINFGTGILEINPFTKPVMPIVETVISAASEGMANLVKEPTSKPAPTQYTTPTIPKYTTDYEQEIKESAAPPIVISKIIAGKIR